MGTKQAPCIRITYLLVAEVEMVHVYHRDDITVLMFIKHEADFSKV